MSDDRPAGRRRFTRVDRQDRSDRRPTGIDRANLADSLDAIDAFLTYAIDAGRRAFVRNSPAYASGSMAIIRTAALFEVDGFRPYLVGVSDDVVRGIMTTRNIASHAGYRAMDDDVLWETLTSDLPPLLQSWRDALVEDGGGPTPGEPSPFREST